MVDRKTDQPKKTVAKSEDQETLLARRLFMRKTTLAIPLIVASFTTSKPVYAQNTCSPNLCDPGDACKPDLCGPQICTPADW